MLSRRQFTGAIGASMMAPLVGAAPPLPRAFADWRGLGRAVAAFLEAHDVVGASVTLTSDEKTLWSEGFGFTDRLRRVPVRPATLFSVQSISKTYTTTAFMRLVAAGALGLDQTLRSVVPEFMIRSRLGPQQQDAITFRQLLAHRAGLPHEAPKGGNWDDCGCSFTDHVRSVFGSWLKAAVGERYSYSNVGIDLAGFAMQQRLGMPFEQLMEQQLLRPLGMASSTFELDQALRHSLALGQLEEKDVPPRPLSIKPSGGLYASGPDMARFIRLHLNQGRIDGRELVPAALLALMGEIHAPVDEQVNGYGLGLERRQWHGRTLLTHGGGGFGYQTEQRWIPEERIGVIVLTNYGGDDAVAQPLADLVLETYLAATRGPLPPTPPPLLTRAPRVEVARDVLLLLEGTYRGYSNVRRFRVEGNQLTVLAGESATPLVSHGPAEFTTERERFRFRLDNFGRPVAIDYLGPNGVDTFFPNGLAREPAGPNRPEWSRYVGDYDGMASGVIPATSTISIDNGYLLWSRGGGTRVAEYQDGLLFAADGESLIFDGDHVSFGNRPFTRKR